MAENTGDINPRMLAWHITPQGRLQKIYNMDEAEVHRFIRRVAWGAFFLSLAILYHWL